MAEKHVCKGGVYDRFRSRRRLTLAPTPIDSRRSMFRHRGSAVITGVSSGTSQAYARRLAGQGYDLILIGADRPRLQTIARRITDASGRSVEVLEGDLGVNEDRQRIAQLLNRDASITLWVNYAPRASCALLPGYVKGRVKGYAAGSRIAVIEVTGKARCPVDDALWSLYLMQLEPEGSLH